jgi:hypothetical protein
MNLSKKGSLWLSNKLWVNIFSVGLLLLLKLPTIHSAVDITLSDPGTFNVIIPASVTALEVDLWGAGGSGSALFGSGMFFAGGSGSYVNCQLTITGPGPTTIAVIVGEGGQAPTYGIPSTSYNTVGTNAIGGGGNGKASHLRSPGGGGGRSTIKNPYNTAEDWVTAGGGGGGGTADIVFSILFLYHFDVSFLCRYRQWRWWWGR